MSILVIDIGSSSVRAILFEQAQDGVRMIPDAIVQRAYEFDTDSTGKATVDANFLRELVEACIDEILKHEAAQAISSVGIDTFVGNLLLLDGNYQPITAIDSYADTRSAYFVDVLSGKLDLEAMHQRTGTILNSAYWLPKLCFYEYPNEAEPFVQRFSDFASYCYQQWFGHDVPMSYSVASWSGMLNRGTLDWDEQSLDAVNWSREMFPDLADISQVQRGLSADYRKRWAMLADVPFYLAVGDGAAAQVGSGAIAANTATLTIGTTAAIRTVRTGKTPLVPQGCWSYRIDAAHHLLGGALSEGGNIFAWARDTLQLDAIDIEAELAQREPASHGLTIVPLLNGERSPGWRSDATGTIHGLRLSTSPMDLVHALLESVALRLGIIAEQLQLDADVKIMAAGGALHHSPAWGQIIADAIGHDLHLIDEAEVTALGVAQMIHCMQKGDDITGAVPKIAHIHKPNTNYSVIYKTVQARQRALYRQTEDL